MKTALLLLLSSFSLFATVQNSITSKMDQLMIKDLHEKLGKDQFNAITAIAPENRVRVVSFNMLFNEMEGHLEAIDRWDQRKERVIEYLLTVKPDIIGSQELQEDQLSYVNKKIGSKYSYYGISTNGKNTGDFPVIFYLKERFQLVKGKTFYFSEAPTKLSPGPFGNFNTVTFAQFQDKQTGKQFIVLNTHLAYGNKERRLYEAKILQEILKRCTFGCPLIVTGDFNTFPFRQDLDLPFYDGNEIVKVIEEGGVKDSYNTALFGHFGPISSTNFSSEVKKAFVCEGEPGVILDHIFVSDGVKVLAHGIDPAKVNDHYPSDHFPVIADLLME